MIQKNAAYLYTGMSVTFFLLFCLYYDKRRRDDPDYKERIRVRRKAARDAVRDDMRIPQEMDTHETQGFFFKEILNGEDKFFKGQMKDAVHHFTNAVVVSPAPEELLDLYERRLPSDIYSKIDERLKSAGYSF